MSFYKEMQSACDELIILGHEVRMPELDLTVPEEISSGKKTTLNQLIEDSGGIDTFPTTHKIWDLKESAMLNHFKKIDWSDGILVLNIEKHGIKGYIGGNTLIEIGIAFYSGKKIFLLNPISSNLSYKQEIIGMKPTILDGDISKIKP